MAAGDTEEIVEPDSALEWLCGCNNKLGWSEFFRLALVSFAVPDNEDVNLSAKKPRRLEEPKTSGLSGNNEEEEGRRFRLVS